MVPDTLSPQSQTKSKPRAFPIAIPTPHHFDFSKNGTHNTHLCKCTFARRRLINRTVIYIKKRETSDSRFLFLNNYAVFFCLSPLHSSQRKCGRSYTYLNGTWYQCPVICIKKRETSELRFLFVIIMLFLFSGNPRYVLRQNLHRVHIHHSIPVQSVLWAL